MAALKNLHETSLTLKVAVAVCVTELEVEMVAKVGSSEPKSMVFG